MESVTLKVTRSFSLDGVMVKPGELVELNKTEGENLLARGRVEPLTSDEVDGIAAPTRKGLDMALASLPGDHTDADYVVRGMRGHFGELFTDDDEAAVRELVKPAKVAK